MRFRGILFDLDGTLLDTAADLAPALNTVLMEQGREPLSLAHIRPCVSHGAQALIELGFSELGQDEREPLRQRLLETYLANISTHTRPFPGVDALIDLLDARRIPWGIVTNKPARFTDPLLNDLGLNRRARCAISGDSTAQAKPHPLPMLTAASRLGVAPQDCLYIGDAERDVQAARNAGMACVVAGFGYLGDNDDPKTWAADAVLETPQALLDWVRARLIEDTLCA
ncbi:MAG: phosphoglycolate phosphatase [Gammaproteobacteria bacterium]|nr:phosphoglycolate phosphatase [Gammaproteobacteria bacterium]MCP5137007.1 phosphoglycolate phosphatase [Gammaproteobacteria bacterium]